MLFEWNLTSKIVRLTILIFLYLATSIFQQRITEKIYILFIVLEYSSFLLKMKLSYTIDSFIKHVFVFLQHTDRFWGRRNIDSCRRTLADTISHSHADRIILIRFEVLKHIVIGILGDWNILSIKYNIYRTGRKERAPSY